MSARLRSAALLLATLVLPLAVQAQSQRGMGPEVEVHVHRETSDWRLENGARVESRVSRLGLSIRDHVADGLWIGIHGGYLELSQSGNPATQGLSLGGWYLGTSGRWRFAEIGPASLSLLGHYTYHDADDESGGQNTRYSWHQYGAGLESAFHLDPVRLRLGVDYSAVDGDEKARGPVQRTFSVSEDETLTARAALDLLVDATGWISFQVESGGRRSAGILFARQF